MSQEQLESECVEAFKLKNKQDAKRLLPQIRQPADIRTTTCNVQDVWWDAELVNPRPEGYGSRFVVHSFVLSTALQRAALTSSLQLRYEQAKRVDGLQSDGWILLKCFRSRVMAGSPL